VQKVIDTANISFDDYANSIKYILDADCMEGSQGLYFRAAEAAASPMGAEYGIVVVTVREDLLRVASTWGLPTKLEKFSSKRGIIGRLYRQASKAEKKYEIVDDLQINPGLFVRAGGVEFAISG